MADSILDQIVDLAHYDHTKIATLQQFKIQTGWTISLAETHWPALSSIIQNIYKDCVDVNVSDAQAEGSNSVLLGDALAQSGLSIGGLAAEEV